MLVWWFDAKDVHESHISPRDINDSMYACIYIIPIYNDIYLYISSVPYTQKRDLPFVAIEAGPVALGGNASRPGIDGWNSTITGSVTGKILWWSMFYCHDTSGYTSFMSNHLQLSFLIFLTCSVFFCLSPTSMMDDNSDAQQVFGRVV